MQSQLPRQPLRLQPSCALRIACPQLPALGPGAFVRLSVRKHVVYTQPRRCRPDKSPIPQLAHGTGWDTVQNTEVHTYAAASSAARPSLFRAAGALINHSRLLKETAR